MGGDEPTARIRTEKFAIEMGWGETAPSYRTPQGTVNVPMIRGNVSQSSHYHPPASKGVYGGRSYVGERPIRTGPNTW
jgi:hypothetical protein